MHQGYKVLVTLGAIAGLVSCQDAPPIPTAVTRTLSRVQGQDSSTDSLAPQGPYVAVDLGTLGGTSGTAFDVNKSGSVVGSALDSSGNRHAFRWSNGVMQDLGTLGGTFSQATSINDAGEIVGTSTTGDGTSFAVVWINGAIQSLGPIAGGGVFVNKQGDVAWSAATPGGSRAFLWHNGAAQDLGTLGGPTSGVSGINDAGSVIGTSSTDSGSQGFVWANGHMQALPSPLPPHGLSPVSIDRHGRIAGTIFVPGETPFQRAFLWDGSSVTLIPVLNQIRDTNGVAVIITDQGDVYGQDSNLGFDNQHPFEWTRGTLIRIDPSWFIAQFVTGANERGTATGYRFLGAPTQRFRAMVWEDGNAWNLGSLTADGESRGLAINANGDVVGFATTSSGNHPALWKRVP